MKIRSHSSLHVLLTVSLISISYAADPVDGEITLTSSAANPDRAILDITGGQLYPNLGFSLSNGAVDSGSAAYTLSGGSHLTSLSDPLGGSVSNGSTNPILGRMDATGLSAGDTRTFTLTADPTTPNLAPVQAAHDVQFVNNRQMSWTTNASGTQLNLGRHKLGSNSVLVTLNSGAGTHANSTDIALYEDSVSPTTTFRIGETYFSYDASLVKDSSGLDVFNAADQSEDYNLQLAFDGLDSREITLGANNIKRSGINFIAGAEGLANQRLEVAPLSITVNGAVIAERQLFSNAASTGERVMVGQTGLFSGTETATVTTVGSDNRYQRLNMAPGIVDGDGISASTEILTQFDSGSKAADVQLVYQDISYGTTASQVDTSVKGRKEVGVVIDTLIHNAELDASFNNTTPSNVQVGVSFDVIEDRALSASDKTGGNAYVALSGSTVSSLYNSVVTTNGGYTTEVGLVDNNTGANQGEVLQVFTDQHRTYGDSFNPGDLEQGGIASGSVAHSGSRSFLINEEGLVGENAQASVGFSWELKYVDAATHTLGGGHQNGDALGSGDSFTISNTGAAVSSADISVSVSSSSFMQVNASGYLVSGGDFEQYSLTAASNLLPGLHQGRLYLSLTNDVSVGRDFGDVGYYEFILNHEVAGPPAVGTKGRKSLITGTSFGDISVGLTNNSEGSRGTNVKIIDSLALTEDVDVLISFEESDLPGNVETEQAASDAVDISGLDGQIIVIQSNYNEADMISKFGSEDVAVLMWWSEEEEQWLNAVAGNSSGGFGPRYEGSYEDFLQDFGVLGEDEVTKELSASLLGAYGWDAENDNVWAVVDHNSTFGGGSAVPEPASAALLLGLIFGTFAMVRRRRG